MSNKIIFFLEYLYVSEKSCTFALQKFNKKIMNYNRILRKVH